MFDVVKKAGLTPTDLSRVLQVNRSTCSMWINGHKQPHHLHVEKVVCVVTAIKKAVKAKALPTALPREPRKRHKRIVDIIGQHLV